MSPEKKSPAKSPFHVVCGSDEFLASSEARKLIDQLCPPADQALGLETINGSVDKADEIAAAVRKALEGVQTVGFFGSGKVVWLRDAFFLGDITQCSSEDVKAALADVVAAVKAGLGEGQILVISASGFDRRTAFFKACQELAALHVYDLPEKPREADAAAEQFCADRFRQAGLKPAPGAEESFLERCGADRRQIANEIDKLVTYLGGRKEFTVDDVQTIVSPTRELIGWDLQDQFGNRELPKAIRTLRQLYFQKEAPIALLIGLEGRIRELLMIKDALQRRWARITGSGSWRKLEWTVPAEADAIFAAFDKDPRRMNEWRAGKLAMQAAGFSLKELQDCHAWITDTHEKMVSSPVPAEMLLELFLIRALGTRRAAA